MMDLLSLSGMGNIFLDLKVLNFMLCLKYERPCCIEYSGAESER